MRDYGIKGQLGLESTYEEYVQHIVEVAKEIWRVLAKDGSFYINLGDTYSGGGSHSKSSGPDTWGKRLCMKEGFPDKSPQASVTNIVPAKCLIGIPWRVAIALIDDGWILRNDIIWYKPNAMPSSVKDRLTNTYEHIFHFVKSKKYYYNLDAIREPHKTKSQNYNEKLHRYIKEISELARHSRAIGYEGKSKNNQGWDQANKNAHAHRDATQEVISKYGLTGELAAALRDYAQNHLGNPLGKNPGDIVKHDVAVGRSSNSSYQDPLHTKAYYHKGKNPGDFWEINTKPHPFAHFAVYPEEICVRPILSSSRVGDVVLDPFMGSGTTGVVAKKLGRNFIGIDLNKEYVEIAEKRIAVAEECSSIPTTILEPNRNQ